MAKPRLPWLPCHDLTNVMSAVAALPARAPGASGCMHCEHGPLGREADLSEISQLCRQPSSKRLTYYPPHAQTWTLDQFRRRDWPLYGT